MSEFDFDILFKSLPNRQLLTLREVADFLRITRRSVYNLYPNPLNGTNISGGLKIYRVSVVDYVKSNHCRKESDEAIQEIERKCNADTKHKSVGWVKNWSRK